MKKEDKEYYVSPHRLATSDGAIIEYVGWLEKKNKPLYDMYQEALSLAEINRIKKILKKHNVIQFKIDLQLNI